MPRFTKGDVVVETAIPREAAQLRAEGFTETKARRGETKTAEAKTAK